MVSGSYENEVLAADYIRRELESISKRANPIHRLKVDIQKPRGSFNLKFVDGLTHHYKDIQVRNAESKTPLSCHHYKYLTLAHYRT